MDWAPARPISYGSGLDRSEPSGQKLRDLLCPVKLGIVAEVLAGPETYSESRIRPGLFLFRRRYAARLASARFINEIDFCCFAM